VTISDLIKAALVELGIYDPNEDISSAEADRGLIVVQGVYDDLWNQAMFGRMTDVIATASDDAEEFTRVQVGAFTITLPSSVDDPITGVTRPPIDLCPVELVTEGQDPARHLYDATRGEWVTLNGLALTDEPPLNNRGKFGLTCLMAVHLAGARAAVPVTTQLTAARFMKSLATKRASTRRDQGSEYF